MAGHPGGVRGGAKAMVQAVDAAFQRIAVRASTPGRTRNCAKR